MVNIFVFLVEIIMRDLTDAVDLIKQFEGMRLTSYKCPAGVWTIGYGSTTFEGHKVTEGMTITEKQAEQQLIRDLQPACRAIDAYVTAPLNNNQYCALVSFVYNIGSGNFKTSTLVKKLNAEDYQGASDELLRWNKSNGHVLEGLCRRREAEKKLFNS